MKISIKKGYLQIVFSKTETLLAVKHSIKIPIKHIKRAHAKRPKTVWKEIRAPGSFLPGVIKAGNYYTPRGREFWFSTRNSKPLVIELKGEKYRHVVIGVKDGNWISKINKSIRNL